MKDEMINRLMIYANAIIGNERICDNQNETMRRIVEYQPEIVLDAFGIKSEKEQESIKEATIDRLKRYSELLKDVDIDDQKTNQMKRMAVYADRIRSVVKSYEKYDYSKEGKIEVNGNIFTYNKEEINPLDYMDELQEIGSAEQGGLFAIYLDDEGRLVIY